MKVDQGQLLKSTLLATAAVAAVASANPAFAQVNPSEAESAEDNEDNVIVVTAQKREQDVQDVPIAITALNEEVLSSAGITDTEDLQVAAPALNVTTAVGGFGLPRIRGIGSTGFGPGIENPVAVYVDGVYYGASSGNLLSIFDAEQVAVLKGPQGTLFGRNATGGLIQITTSNPSLSQTEVRGRFGYGNFDTFRAAGFVSIPLADTLAVSVTGQYEDRNNGYGTNLFTGRDVQTSRDFSGRAKLLWEPSPDTSVLVIGDISDSQGANPAFRPIGNNTQGVNVQAQIEALGGDPEYDILADFDPSISAEQRGASVTIEQALGSIELKSITAYRYTELNSAFDPDGTTVPQLRINNLNQDKQFTQEFNLISDSGGSLEWVVGLFYLWNESGLLPFSETTGLFVFGDNGFSRTTSVTTLNSYSAFAEGTFAVGPSTNLTAGIRYTYDEREFDGFVATLNANIPGATEQIGSEITEEANFDNFSWRLSLDHRFSEDFLAYASYNRGFRSGGFVVQIPPLTTLQPEEVDAFEVGFKADPLPGVRTNLAAYYYDQTSVQVFQIIQGRQFIFNANGAEIFGFDGDISVDVSDRFTLFGGFSYTDATYSDYPDAILTTPLPLPQDFTLPPGQLCQGTFVPPPFAGNELFFYQNISSGGNCLLFGDATGEQLQNTPEFSFSVGANLDIPVSFGEFSFAANLYHNGGFNASTDGRVRQGSYEVLNASITYFSPNQQFYVRAFGRNLTEAFYFTQLGASNSGDNGIPAAPRTYGVEVGFEF